MSPRRRRRRGSGRSRPGEAESPPPDGAAEARLREARLDDRQGRPSLSFTGASITMHLLVEGLGPPGSIPDDPFTYHQRDFISYAYRDDPPFVVVPVPIDAAMRLVTCELPEVQYEAGEGLRRLPARPLERRFDLSVRRTYFTTSKLSVLLITLTAQPPGSDEPDPAEPSLCEFDVIRLAKLWEGEGTASICAGPKGLRLAEHRPWTMFGAGAPPARLDGAQLLEMVRALPELRDSTIRTRPVDTDSATRAERPYLTGSVQLQSDRKTMAQLVARLRRIQEPAGSRSTGQRGARAQLLALSGVLRAFMAFDDTYWHELPSIFRETSADARMITAVHKGTFLRVAEDMRMPSAYFLLPHTIALHNEALLDTALHSVVVPTITAQGAGGRRPRRAAPLDAARRATSKALNHCIDAETIHYPNLRALYESAASSRGLDGLDARARRYVDEVRVESDAIRAGQQSLIQLVIAVFALVFAALQVTNVVGWYVVAIPIALILILLVVQRVRR